MKQQYPSLDSEAVQTSFQKEMTIFRYNIVDILTLPFAFVNLDL